MNQALLYVRVSSKEQEQEGYSLDAQEKMGYEYAHRKNFKIIKLWKVAESAWKQERKAFGQMVDYALRHPEIEHIIFDVLDRMTRNDFDKLKIHGLVREHGKTIHFSRSNKIMNRDSGPDDEFMFDIEVAVAKKLSNDISRKASMGMREKAEQGSFPSVAPMGYVNNLLTHQIDVDPERAPHIKKIFALMATGAHSLASIREILTQEGLRSRKGNTIGKTGIAHFLNNPIYYGAFRWSGRFYKGIHEPLITKYLFDKAQAVMHGKSHPSTSKKRFVFNGLLRCGICGCRVLGETKKGRFTYYHCTFSKGRHEGKGYFREHRLVELLAEPIKKITLSKDMADRLAKDFKEANEISTRLQTKRMEVLKYEYDKVKTRLSRLYDTKFDGEIDGEIFEIKKMEYNNHLAEIRQQLEKPEDLNPLGYENGIKILEISKRLYSLYVREDDAGKVKILNLVASNYTLNDVSVVPIYRKPFDIIAEMGSRTI